MADTLTHTGTLTWNVDPTHSSIDFTIKHLGIFTVRGTLGHVTGTAETTDTKLSKVSISIDATAINTRNEQRDAHLKSPDFLNTDAYPAMTFESTSITEEADGTYAITGDFSLAGQTHPFTVKAEIHSPVKDPWGNTRGGASGAGVLKRSEWGITFNSVMETGGVMLSDEVNFTFDIQAVVAA